MLSCLATSLLLMIAAPSSGAVDMEQPRLAVITPHEQYSSSVGVLGCKINTNRVAYWPEPVDCDNICVKVSHAGRSLHLLRIDSSAGAYDISYDAWNYLGFGVSAADVPHVGGGLPVEYAHVPADECSSLLYRGVLPLSAANSMNYVGSCLQQPDSWVAGHHELINIFDPVCNYGYDETCGLDLATSNQPQCPHTLGSQNDLPGLDVINIVYGTGQLVAA